MTHWVTACLALVAATLSLFARAESPTEPPPDAIIGDLPFLDSPERSRIFLNLAPEGSKPFRLMLDTGAGDSVLTPRYARELGVTVRKQRDRPNERETVLGRSLQFWIDTDSSESASRTGWEYGLLGGVFLGEYVLDLDFANRRVRFIDPDKWRVPESVSAPGEAVLPLRVVGNRPFVNVEIDGKTIDVLVDTGAPLNLLLAGRSAKKAGIEKPPLATLAMAGVLGPIESYLVEASSLALGPFEYAPAPIVFAPHGAYNQGGSTDSALGYDVLEHFRVRLDYRHKRIWLRRSDEGPLTWQGQSWAAARRAGLVAAVGEAGIVVYAVIPDSPADKLGVRPGDEIEFHGTAGRDKVLAETLATIEAGGRLTVVRGATNESPGEQVELGDAKPVTPAN